jgi:hypothetical protein
MIRARAGAGCLEQLVQRRAEARDERPSVGNGLSIGHGAEVELIAVAPDGEVQRRPVCYLAGGEPSIKLPLTQIEWAARTGDV